uniref:Uncharacterized protein n=1 Tax=Parascaris equorum TaxID=6256 RepID=A0A914SG81_PAREQ
MIAYEISDDSSFHEGTPMRESAFGSSKTTSLDAVGSDVSIHLPSSAAFSFPATSSQLNSRSYQHSKRRSAERRSSNSSTHSETRTNLILQNVGRTIQRLDAIVETNFAFESFGEINKNVEL